MVGFVPHPTLLSLESSPMYYNSLLLAATIALSQLAAGQEVESPPTTAIVPDCVVAAAEQADLPPYEPGVLMQIKAHEGQQVDAKELLVQLDDRKAQRELEVAQAKFSAAQAKANDDINVRYASSERRPPRPSTKSASRPTTTSPARSPP